ncbi:MAG: hypothetical protein ACREHF_12085 [Rhizomicrobium sp.]
MRTMLLTALVGMSLVPGLALADSPFDGTWKADLNSVDFSKKPDVYVLKDGMYTCKTCAPAYTIKADGSDQRVSGHPGFDTVAIKVVDAHTVQQTNKKGGKTVYTETDTVAPDGKTVDIGFTDSSNSKGSPVTGKVSAKQVAAGPTKSNAISGSWITTSVSGLSDAALSVTYKTDGDMLSMTDPTGESFDAKMDGTEAAFNGSPDVTNVSVKKAGARTLVQTTSRNGKIVNLRHMTVSKDGKTMKVSSHNEMTGQMTSWTNQKS